MGEKLSVAVRHECRKFNRALIILIFTSVVNPEGKKISSVLIRYYI